MISIVTANQCGAEIERLLLLKTSPIAIRFLAPEEAIPADAFTPKKDRGYHLALCQAFAMVRQQRRSIAMTKEDHWCFSPLEAFGLVEPLSQSPAAPGMVEDPAAADRLAAAHPHLPQGQYACTVMAPLSTASFEPHLVLIYSNTSQLRTLLLAIKYKEGALISSVFDPIDSCVFSTIPTLLEGQYRITIPDPGEYERAGAGEDEIILSVPAAKLENLVLGLKRLEERGGSYRRLSRVLRPDFPQPEFYKKLFKQWGLDKQ